MMAKIWKKIFRRKSDFETLYPKSFEDVQEILLQAQDNRTPVKVTGGSYPLTPAISDIVVNLCYLNRLIALDLYRSTVTVESGMKLSELEQILESVSLSLDMYGRVPNLTICDAVAVGGAFGGGNSNFMSNLASCEVVLANGKMTTWTWDTNVDEMKTLCCGLGMTAILLSVTLKCIPLQKFTEISYLCSIRDIMDHWNMQFKSSFCQQLTWFPFSELMVMTHLNPTEPYLSNGKQSWFNHFMEKLSEYCSHFARRLGILAHLYNIPMLSSILSRVQFIAQWSVAKHRSDFSHSPTKFWTPAVACRGANWLIPRDKLPNVLYNISVWTHSHSNSDTACGVSPLFIQTMKMESKMSNKKPYMAPYLDQPAVSIWYDWFDLTLDLNPIAIAEFEDIFHEVGAIRTWSGERLTSPLVLSKVYKRYDRWCRNKGILDSGNVLHSAYIQGTVYCANRGGYSSISSSMSSLFVI